MQIKNVGGIPSNSHRNLTLQAGWNPKAFVSSLEIVPSVILGCDLIAEAHRDSETITVPAVIGCPIQPRASRSSFLLLAKRDSAANTTFSHHNKTMPEIKQPPEGGRGGDAAAKTKLAYLIQQILAGSQFCTGIHTTMEFFK